MGRVFLPIFAHIRHMAVNTSNPIHRVNRILPSFIIRMLSLEHRRLGIGMNPVLRETARMSILIILIDLLGIEAIIPWLNSPAIFLGEIILVMALAANIGTHLIMGCLADINATASHSLDKALLINAQFHRLRIMAA